MKFINSNTLYNIGNDLTLIQTEWITNCLFISAYNNGIVQLCKVENNRINIIDEIGYNNPIIVKNKHKNSVLIFDSKREIDEYSEKEDFFQKHTHYITFSLPSISIILPQNNSQYYLIDNENKLYSFKLEDNELHSISDFNIDYKLTCGCLIDNNKILVGSNLGNALLVQISPFNITLFKLHSDSIQDIVNVSLHEFITVSRDKTIACWSIDNFDTQWIIEPNNSHFINCIEFDKQKSVLYIGDSDGYVRMINIGKEKIIKSKKVHKDAIRKIKLSPNYGALLTISDDGMCKIINTELKIQCHHKKTRSKITAIDYNSEYTVLGKHNGNIIVSNTEHFDTINIISTISSIRSVKLLDKNFVCGLENGILEVRDFKGELQRTIRGNKSPIYSINYHNKQLYCGRRNGILDIYNIDNDFQLVCSEKIHRSIIGDILLNKNEIITCSDDQCLKIFDSKLKVLKEMSHNCTAINNLSYFSDNILLATTDDNKILVINRSTYEIKSFDNFHKSAIRAICTLLGTHVISGDRDGLVVCWEFNSKHIVWNSKFCSRIIDIIFDSNTNKLTIVSENEVRQINIDISNHSNNIKAIQTNDESNNILNILHLSDFHFKVDSDCDLWYTQLATDIKYQLNCNFIDYLIISGDIANFSISEEYNLAIRFIENLCREFNVEKHKIIAVPGNHDINWELSQESYSTDHFDTDYYKKRFCFFGSFYKVITGIDYDDNYENQFVIRYETKNNLLFLGLNSSWEVDHINKDRVSINTKALANAMDKIRNNETYQKAIKIAICHHPINDTGLFELLNVSGFRLVIHGHCHKADNQIYKYYQTIHGENIEIMAGGTFGAPTKELVPAYPWQYNFLKIDNSIITVETRKREKENGAWKPDARWQESPKEDPKPRYTINLK